MRCEEYLQLLSTLPVEELVDGRSGDHLGTCPDCNRATKLVVERERNMMMALGGMSSQMQPLELSRASFALAQQRKMSRWYIGGLATLLVAITAVVLDRTIIPAKRSHIQADAASQIFRPSCLSPQSAAELLRQYVASPSLTVSIPQGGTMMMLGGSIEDLMRARSVLDRYDNPTASTCMPARIGAPKPASAGGLTP